MIVTGFVTLAFSLVFNIAKLIALILFIACCLKYLRKDK